MKKSLSLIFLLLVTSGLLFSQEVYKKKEIAVFNLSYYQWNIPRGVLGSIDAEIRGVFTNLGRFNVIGMNYRLGTRDVNTFIEKIKQFKEENVKIPEKVQMGKEFFTQADMNRLIGSFIVVIPSVTYFSLERSAAKRLGNYKCVLKTSFTFIDVENIRTISTVNIETEGYDDNPNEAVRDAVESIPDSLTFEVRKIPEFQLKTGIVEINGSDVIIEFGRDMGVKVGDEYSVLTTRVLSSGRKFTEEKAFLIVKEVSDEVSVAHVVYSKGKLNIGDQVREIPRFGLDTTPYFHLSMDIFGRLVGLVGFRQSISRGFYRFRPQVGLEVPFLSLGYNGVPTNIYIGGEMNWYLWRFQFVPMIAAGVGGIIPFRGDYFRFTHIGGQGNITITYLLSRDMKIAVDIGYLKWLGLSEPTYGGLFAGLGFMLKY